MEIDDKFRVAERAKASSHSNYVTTSNGRVKNRVVNGACYAGLFFTHSVPIDRLFIFFGNDTIKAGFKPELYCDWLINESCYADVFITKCSREGFKKGFEISVDQHPALTKAACMMLRHPFEMKGWGFSRYLGKGFNPLESLALSTQFLVTKCGNTHEMSRTTLSGHLMYQRYNTWKHYTKKPTLLPRLDTLRTGLQSSVNATSTVAPYDYNPAPEIALVQVKRVNKSSFGMTRMVNKFSKYNCRKVLEILRGRD